MTPETIFAPASGSGPAGIAVIRVSGPRAGTALAALIRRKIPEPRRATRAGIFAADGERIDSGIVIWFPAPGSFTGEDVAELHVHGGRAVIDGVLEALGQCPGLRAADPGEFSRRAFDNGKLDLTAAEGLADLVNAETPAQRRQALRQMRGELAALYDGWRERLVRTIAHLEATIDFADEELPEGLETEVVGEVEAVIDDIHRHLDDGGRGERLRDGIHVAIIGPPNAGKSSLFNVLARRNVAIVSARPGTTRDVIEVPLNLGGYAVVLADTAGLRQTVEEIEREGVRRAWQRAEEADIRLAVVDGAKWPNVDPELSRLIDDDTVVVINKCDLGRVNETPTVGGRKALAVSAMSGAGIEAMVMSLVDLVATRYRPGEAPGLTRRRHREALEACEASLARCLTAGEVEMMAEDLRLAARALGRITGRVEVEEILDVVFRDFCIGK